MAVVPMPLVPPWMRIDSPGCSSAPCFTPRWNTFVHTVKNVSGSAAASNNSSLYVLDFGVVGDGVPDDSTAIQRCIDALPNAGGIELLVLSGEGRWLPATPRGAEPGGGPGTWFRFPAGIAPRFIAPKGCELYVKQGHLTG